MDAAAGGGAELEDEEMRADDERDRGLDQIRVRGAQPAHGGEDRDDFHDDGHHRDPRCPTLLWVTVGVVKHCFFLALRRPAPPAAAPQEGYDGENRSGEGEGDAGDVQQRTGRWPGPTRPQHREGGHDERADAEHSHANTSGKTTISVDDAAD